MFEGTLAPVSNQEDWKLTVEIVDDDTGEDIDLTGASIVFEVRDPRNRATVLSATTNNSKVTLLDDGTFQVFFARAEMQMLRAQTYEVGCIVSVNGETKQFILSTIPILDGVVTQ
jgi:hypothetical protein